MRFRNDGSSRRDFLKATAAGAAALAFAPPGGAGQAKPAPAKGAGFKLNYAPDLGLFEASAGKNPADQLKFIADQGFPAWFDNGLMGKPPAEQEALAKESQRLGLTIGPFVVYADFSVESFVIRDTAINDMLAARFKTAVETGRRTGCRWTLAVPGRYNQRLDWDYQTANVVENLKRMAAICEPSGLVIALEPLNPKDHPGLFLTKMAQAFQICKAVGSPSVKILDDMYHQQITEGNIIPNIDACWDELAAFHVGDSPGRKEPGTGEMNYRNIFKHIHGKGYKGVLCLEHGLSRKGIEGEKALLAAYRDADNF
ncbi:MAG: TIM barrel protein [Candidatus Aminicenantes bacterium]|nr:TIM barrel protein [Candidatus Aminicenantes bacterium]